MESVQQQQHHHPGSSTARKTWQGETEWKQRLLEITYPEDDGVLSLKDGDELVSAGDLGLVQWPKSTQNLDVAFRVRISHCAGTNSGRRAPRDKEEISTGERK